MSDWEKRVNYLENCLINGTVSTRFLVENASDKDWYGAMVLLSKRLKYPQRFNQIIKGVLKQYTGRKKKDSCHPKIIGTGSPALKILSLFKGRRGNAIDIVFLDNDPGVIALSPFHNLSLPWVEMLFASANENGQAVPLSWGGVHHGGVDLARLMALRFIEEIIKPFQNVSSVLVLSCLGGAVGSGVTPVLVAALKQMVVSSDLILQLPLSFEGKMRIRNALQSLELIRNFSTNLDIIEGDEVLHKKPEKHMTAQEAFGLLNYEMTEKVSIFFKMGL